MRRARHVSAAIALLALQLLVAPPTASAVTCNPDAPLPWTSDPGTAVLRDNYETGDFRRWSRVVREGDAAVWISSTRHHDGYCSGRMRVTSQWDSRANVQKYLGSTVKDVWANGWFRIDGQGGWGSNVPTFRLFYGTQRILDVHRQNVGGDLWLRTYKGNGDWKFVRLGVNIPLYTWFQVKVRVYANWSSSVVSVWVNGVGRYSNYAYYLPAGHITMAMIGSEHQKQVMDLSFDTTTIKVS